MQALNVDPDELEITKGASGTATISGTWAPYTAVSDKPSLTPTVSGTTLTVAADANAAATATVTVTDSKGNTFDVAITTVDA